MMKTRQKITIGVLLIGTLSMQSCMFSLQTKTIKKEGITSTNTIKGKAILNQVWKSNGYDKLDKSTVYSFNATDTWRGVMAKMGQIWPEMESKMEFKYLTGTFDGQIKFLDGKEMGTTVGLQNWNYYESTNGNIDFLDIKAKANKRKAFGIAAFQYFTEMISRLKNAPIISYAGQKEFRGQVYDLVFCTWETEKSHKEHDQYLVWVNKSTGNMDIVQYTLRDNYLKMPGVQMMGGAIEFTNLKNIGGVMIPFTQYVYAIKPQKKQKKFLHKLEISTFEFDQFNKDLLIVDKAKQTGGDYK